MIAEAVNSQLSVVRGNWETVKLNPEIASPLRLIGFGGLRPTQRYPLSRACVLFGSEGQLGWSSVGSHRRRTKNASSFLPKGRTFLARNDKLFSSWTGGESTPEI